MFPNYEVRMRMLSCPTIQALERATRCSSQAHYRLAFSLLQTAVERDTVRDPFVEVTMFKRNFDHVIKETYFKHYKCAQGARVGSRSLDEAAGVLASDVGMVVICIFQGSALRAVD